MSKRQKNVVLIITDQQRATEVFAEENRRDFGVEGKLELPAMRRLRRHGISFTNAICNSCMCTPSRSTLFSGVYPAKHSATQTLTYGGVFSPSQPTLDPSKPNMARMFSEAGYDVQYRGKWHLSKSPDQPDIPDALSEADVSLYGFQGWIGPDAGEDADPLHFGGGWPNQDARYVREAIEYLTEKKNNRGDAPFLLVLSLVNPHDVLAYPKSVDFGYVEDNWTGRKLALPPSVSEDLRQNHKPSAHWQLAKVMDGSLGSLPTDEDKLNYLNFYGYLCEKIDDQINEVLDVFFDGDHPNKFFRDTVIIRTADHGEMGMAHGGLRQKAFNVYEETLRVPMIWSNPDWFGEPKVSDSLMSLIDVMPTLAGSVLSTSTPARYLKWMKGTNMSATFNDPKSAPQEEILFTYDDIRASSSDQLRVVYAPDRIRCLRTARWKYAEYFSADSSYEPQYEFYDLDWDAHGKGLEFQNLYYDREGYPHWDEAGKELKRLQERLPRAMAEKLTAAPENPADPFGG